jgi:hypothetical protein
VLLGYALSVSNIISLRFVKSTFEKYHSKIQYYVQNKVVQTVTLLICIQRMQIPKLLRDPDKLV